MSSSPIKSVSAPFPPTCPMSKKQQPKQPDCQPGKRKRPQGGIALGLHDTQGSKRLAQETQDQLEVQQQVGEAEEMETLSSDELEDESLEDSLEEQSLGEGAGCDTAQNTSELHKNDGRKQQPVGNFFRLRYKFIQDNTKEAAEKANQVAEGSSVDSFCLHPSGSSEEKDQEEDPKCSAEVLSFHRPNVSSNEPFRPPTKGKRPAGRAHPSTHGPAFPLQIPDQPQPATKNSVEKNKETLGLCSEQSSSYLQIHKKKQEALPEQDKDPNTVDEEPVQSVLPLQTVKMEPGDKWYLKTQQLKDHHQNSSQRKKIRFDQSPREKPSPRITSQHPPAKPADPKLWHHKLAEIQALPMQTMEQDKKSRVQEWLDANPFCGPAKKAAETVDLHLNNFPKSPHVVLQDVPTPAYPAHPTPPKFQPAEAAPPAPSSKGNKEYQHGSPRGPSHHLSKCVTMQLSAGGGSTRGQALLKQRNISSTLQANFQESVKGQLSLQDCKGHKYKKYQLSAVSSSSSPAAPSTISKFTQLMDLHHQDTSGLTKAHLTGRLLLPPLPPRTPLPSILTQVKSGSQVDPQKCKGNKDKRSKNKSEGSLMQVEKDKQPKVSKKLCGPKPCINLDLKLGGLGPNYEAIKEKKEKLKQRQEHAKQVKAQNMRSTTGIQRFPTKPQALEHAKKLLRPKTSPERQLDREMREKKVLPQTLKGESLPQIASSETLQSRHEKEKQIIDAFRTLHL